MSMIPEEEVGEFINSGRFKRVRDQNRPQMKRAMQELAFVSLIDENEEMARMACRMALAYCHCRNFNEGITGSFPGVTWHHRSFSEIFVCEAIVQVMDWAGGMLTWHGKDIMYDALMMKGLPRMDSDIKTLDDIWYTNQGMVFISTMIATLITLTTRYPRYRVRVEEAEKDFFVMWENYVCWDGGSSEGGSYWNYTMDNVVNCIILLSRYNGKNIEEYAPDSVKRTGAYVSALLSEAWRSVGYIPYSDSHLYSSFSPMAINFLACVGAGDIWKQYLIYKYNIKGFLHWGFNYYYSRLSYYPVNPYLTTSADGAFPSGEPYIVYPSKDGVYPSVRGEITYEAIQDLNICRTLEKYIGRAAVVEMIDKAAGFELRFDQYPRNKEFIEELRAKMIEKISKEKM